MVPGAILSPASGEARRVYQLTDEEFDRVVEDALAAFPDRFIEAFENVAIVVADEPTPHQLRSIGRTEAESRGSELLGLYEGVPLTERGSRYGDGEVPDVISIFKGPHERCFATREGLVEQIRKTVVHEVGHYFGNDEETLRAMGY